MWWGFELEFKSTLRTKKLWVILGIMTLLYIPSFYIAKSNGVKVESLNDAMSVLVGNVNSSASFFIAILAILMGATAINSEIEKGTLRVAMSKPIRRISYILGKFTAHAAILLLALLIATIISVAGVVSLGAPLGAELFKEATLLNMLLLLAMIQLVALGYILSTLIKSSSTALGAALAIFFVIFLIVPSIVQFVAMAPYITSDGEIDLQKAQERADEYTKKYLFFVPTSQIDIIVRDARNIEFSSGELKMNYLGIAHGIRENLPSFLSLVFMTIAYLTITFYRFLRMDLR